MNIWLVKTVFSLIHWDRICRLKRSLQKGSFTFGREVKGKAETNFFHLKSIYQRVSLRIKYWWDRNTFLFCLDSSQPIAFHVTWVRGVAEPKKKAKWENQQQNPSENPAQYIHWHLSLFLIWVLSGSSATQQKGLKFPDYDAPFGTLLVESLCVDYLSHAQCEMR